MNKHNALPQEGVNSLQEEKVFLLEERNKLLIVIKEHKDTIDVLESENDK